MAKATGRGRKSGPKTKRERARAFAFEGLPEQDRFGIFDPALRGFFVLGILFAMVFSAGWVVEAGRGSTSAIVGAIVLAIAVAGVGLVGFRRIWRRPAEREMLLAMAQEDEESRAARARRAKAAAERRDGAHGRDGERSHD